jgi:hypothetical protein
MIANVISKQRLAFETLDATRLTSSADQLVSAGLSR